LSKKLVTSSTGYWYSNSIHKNRLSFVCCFSLF